MAGNFRTEGEHLNYTNSGGSAIASGAVVVMGTLVGVALVTIPVGGVCAVRICGVFSLAKLGTDVIAQGANVYWDAANSRITTTASGNTLAGKAAAAAGNGATTVDVLINGLC